MCSGKLKDEVNPQSTKDLCTYLVLCYLDADSKIAMEGVPVISSYNLIFEDVIGKGNFAVVYRGKWDG